MLDPVKNFAKVEVSTGYSDTDTTVVLASGEGAKLPDPSTDGEFNLTWWNETDYQDPSDDPNKEIVRVTARSSDTLTIIRAQEGTIASNKNIAGKTYKMILTPTKKLIDDINDFQKTGWNRLASSGTYVSATSLALSGDFTSIIQKGDKIKLTNDGSTKYFYITDVSYSSPDTTVTITPKAGGASLVSGAISNLFFSKAANPQGFEQIDTTGIADGAVTLDKTLNLVGCNANQRQIRFGTYVTTTNASGEATVVYSGSFPTGTLTAVAINGDSGVGNIIYHIKRPHSATGFTVVVRVADSGALLANSAVRIDYIAIGY